MLFFQPRKSQNNTGNWRFQFRVFCGFEITSNILERNAFLIGLAFGFLIGMMATLIGCDIRDAILDWLESRERGDGEQSAVGPTSITERWTPWNCHAPSTGAGAELLTDDRLHTCTFAH